MLKILLSISIVFATATVYADTFKEKLPKYLQHHAKLIQEISERENLDPMSLVALSKVFTKNGLEQRGNIMGINTFNNYGDVVRNVSPKDALEQAAIRLRYYADMNSDSNNNLNVDDVDIDTLIYGPYSGYEKPKNLQKINSQFKATYKELGGKDVIASKLPKEKPKLRTTHHGSLAGRDI